MVVAVGAANVVDAELAPAAAVKSILVGQFTVISVGAASVPSTMTKKLQNCSFPHPSTAR